ncbi:MAG TPA: hypothetical protein VJZ50_04530 [Candidatus Limnocylindrales bacterium]|nr:hypothetical protein [Candidatus Limnocylindrales bacterium]
MSGRGRLPWSLALSVALFGVLIPAEAALAQDPAPIPVQVQVSAVGASGVAGIALLYPAASGTAVQLLVVGAPAGTTAVIHPGRCDAPDSALVALLGDVGVSGQVQLTVPVSFEMLTDGAHVVALHPGLDMATQLGCGAIPAVVAPVPDGPDASAAPTPVPVDAPPALQPIEAPTSPPTPEPTHAPTPGPTLAPTPTLDPACVGVEPWIAATEGRISRISEALSDLNTVAGRYDLPAYLAGLASLEGEVQVMVSRQSQEVVPGVAGEVNGRAISAFETYVDAARQIYDSLTTSVDVNTYSRAMSRYQEATELIGEVQRGIGELRGRCATS